MTIEQKIELEKIGENFLKSFDELFTQCVDELDSWNGYADGFRAYEMWELDELYAGAKASKLIEDLTSDFNINDNYFYWSIYGLESTDSKVDLYRDNVWEKELLEQLSNRWTDLDLEDIDEDFAKICEYLDDKEIDGEKDEDVAELIDRVNDIEY